MTVTLNVGFSVLSNLNLTTAQIDSYKAAISSQLNSTFMEASGGLISATMSFDGGKDPNRFTPEIALEDGSDRMGLGVYIMGQKRIGISVGKAESLLELGETGVHELFHTLNIDDVADTPHISDTRLNRVGNQYLSTSTTAFGIRNNIMSYGSTIIDGKSYRGIYGTGTGMNRLTKGQLDFLIKSILKQMRGYGQMPVKKENESDKEYEKRKKKYYDDYWLYPEDM